MNQDARQTQRRVCRAWCNYTEANTGCTERLFWRVPRVQACIPLRIKQAGSARTRIAVGLYGAGCKTLKAHG